MTRAADDPLALAQAWLDEGERTRKRNPLAMAIATSTRTGTPSVRMVLLRGYVPDPGFIVFYTNYGSRKGRELSANAHAAGVLYWEELGRQLRIEGPVTRSPEQESDAYFATRPQLSQLNAWVSAQSQPIADLEMLTRASERKAQELGIGDPNAAPTARARIPRPAHWGGFRLWVQSIEFWTEGTHRFHERAVYTRTLERGDGDRFSGSEWTHVRLQP